MGKIMLLTSQYTGRGHMSIAEALMEHFERMKDLTVDVVDGFIFMGRQGVTNSKIYNVITRRAKFIWKAAFEATQVGDFVPHNMGYLVQKRLVRYVRATQPDLILSVHPMFVGSVIDALERNGLNIPVVCLEADLVNIHSAWCDVRVAKIICPTKEAFDRSVELGMPEEKLITIGFPTRGQFCKAARNRGPRKYPTNRPMRCLMTAGGGGAGEIEEFARTLMRETDVQLTVICGSNEKLREKLEAKFGIKYSDRMRILGFVTDMESEYSLADAAILRASPNCMFEAIVMDIPMVLTGALPGQEQDNPLFAEAHGLGVICQEPEHLAQCIAGLLANDCAQLKQISENQQNYRDLDSAFKVAKYVYDMM